MQKLSGGTWSVSQRRLLLLLNPLEEANASDFLRRHGFDLAIARDSQSAIMSLRCRPADAAIIDVALPSENGYEASRRIRAASSRARHLPILLVSAPVPGIHAKAFQAWAGVDAFLFRPFEPVDLLVRLETMLESYVQA
jgi:DNA-binding response OmpR family regulator